MIPSFDYSRIHEDIKRSIGSVKVSNRNLMMMELDKLGKLI